MRRSRWLEVVLPYPPTEAGFTGFGTSIRHTYRRFHAVCVAAAGSSFGGPIIGSTDEAGLRAHSGGDKDDRTFKMVALNLNEPHIS